MSEDLTWFWAIVDKGGFANVPSSERDALRMLSQKASERDALREENARLLEALEPFAARLDELEKMKASKYACATSVEIEHLRAARAAIAKARGETGENAG